jgi:GNAT superfamily N-acetyltransferase
MGRSYAKAAPPAIAAPTIRRAGPLDAEVLAAVGAACFSEAFGEMYPPADLAAFLAQDYGVERARRDLADARLAAWLVEAGGAAVGHALAGPCDLPHGEVTAGCGEVKRIYLLEAWQGGGTGSRLLEAVLAWLEREGSRRLWIGVWSRNFGAQRLYGRLGFAKVGEYAFEVGATRDHEFILRRG